MKNLYTIRKMQNETVEKLNLIRKIYKLESVASTIDFIATNYIELNQENIENELKNQMANLLGKKEIVKLVN
tara:strand:+ start:2919 stop:3134 length:216 start_codon:yes stop_codon:yes gene_type:complete